MTKPIAYIGIDPGSLGQICLLSIDYNTIEFCPTNINPIALTSWFNSMDERYDVRVIMIEEVHSIHGTSAKSNFTFGYNVGYINALAGATGLGIDKVTPKVWQKEIGVKQALKGPARKKEIAAICQRLYPKAVIHGPKGGLLDGKSDSLCIAHCAYLKYNQIR